MMVDPPAAGPPAIVASAPPAAAAASPPADGVDAVIVTGKTPIIGDMKTGVLAYAPDFFTAVRPGNAMDMIKWLPGFAFEDVRDVRGLGGALGNVLIDGQPPTSKSDSLSTVLGRIPASQVERVDLIVGGAPGIDMRGRAVIANVILKKTSRPQGNAFVDAYVQQGKAVSNASISYALKRDDRTIEASLDLSDFRSTAFGAGKGTWLRRDGTGALVFAARTHANGDYPFGKLTGAYERPALGGKLRFTGSLQYQGAPFSETALVYAPAPAVYLTNQEDRWKQGEAGVRYERALSPHTTLETQLLERLSNHRQASDDDRPPAPQTLDENDDISESVIRATVRYKPDDKLTVETAGETALNEVDTRSAETVNHLPVPLPGGDVDVKEVRSEAGVTSTWKPNDRYSLIAALGGELTHLTSSGDVNLTHDLAYVKPRLVFSIAPNKDTQLRFRLEHEVGQINFNRFTSTLQTDLGAVRLGNPNLLPQQSLVAEAVVERRFWNGGVISLTARAAQLKNVVDTIPVIVGGQRAETYGNAGNGTEQTAILSLTLPLAKLGLRGVVFKGSATRDWTEVTDPTTLATRPTGQPQWIGEAHLNQDLPRWKLNWGIDFNYYGGTTAYRPSGLQDYGPLRRLVFFAERRFGEHYSLRFDLYNATEDAQWRRITGYAGPRNAFPLLYVDDKIAATGRAFRFRLRRTFN